MNKNPVQDAGLLPLCKQNLTVLFSSSKYFSDQLPHQGKRNAVKKVNLLFVGSRTTKIERFALNRPNGSKTE